MNSKLLNFISSMSLTVIVSTLISCSTLSKSVLLGGSIGGTAGGAMGSQNGNTDSGAALGALVGAGLGNLVFQNKHKQSARPKSSSDRLELDDLDSPFLKSPKVRKYWHQDKIEGKKFIKGHWIYEIEEQPVWMQ